MGHIYSVILRGKKLCLGSAGLLRINNVTLALPSLRWMDSFAACLMGEQSGLDVQLYVLWWWYWWWGGGGIGVSVSQWMLWCLNLLAVSPLVIMKKMLMLSMRTPPPPTPTPRPPPPPPPPPLPLLSGLLLKFPSLMRAGIPPSLSVSSAGGKRGGRERRRRRHQSERRGREKSPSFPLCGRQMRLSDLSVS